MNDMELNEKIKDLQNLDIQHRQRIWKPYMEKYHCDTICEIGVRTGDNFYKMIEHSPRLAVAIDCWTDDGILGRNDVCLNQDELDTQYNAFKDSVADKPYVKIHRGYSFDAVKEFPDEYFDFIYIDADHTYEGCSRDIKDWWPKVKKGGVFCGHDYQGRSVRTKNGRITFGVKPAVKEFVKANHLHLFILQPIIWGIIKC